MNEEIKKRIKIRTSKQRLQKYKERNTTLEKKKLSVQDSSTGMCTFLFVPNRLLNINAYEKTL